MSTSTAIGAKVKILRIGKEMTIKQLSEACGLSLGFLSQFERGISSIAIDSLETIANVLGVPLSELFVETEDKVPTEEPEDPVMHGMELIPSQASAQMYQYILKQRIMLCFRVFIRFFRRQGRRKFRRCILIKGRNSFLSWKAQLPCIWKTGNISCTLATAFILIPPKNITGRIRRQGSRGFLQ